MKAPKIIACLCIMALSFGLQAQPKQVVKQYNYWINQAELAICDSNYQKASDCYHQAFSIKRPCTRHAYFAFQLNQLFSYNLERACEAFHFLVLAGDKAYYEDGSPYLDDTTAFTELWHCMKTISDTTKSLVDENLYNALSEICKEDQQVRFADYESDEEAYATMGHTDSLNFQKVRQIFKQYKNIDEYNSGRAVMLNAVFIHFARCGFTTPDVYYAKMVKNGNFPDGSYMNLYDQCYHTIFKADDKTTYGTDPSYIYVIKNTFFVRYPDDIQKVNKNRKKLNSAETWADYMKKVMYVYYNDTPFRFYPQQFVVYGDDATQEQIEKDERDRYDRGEVKGVYYDFMDNQ